MARGARARRSGAAMALGPRAADRAGGAMRDVLVLGGTSEIGLAIMSRLAAEGPIRPYLVGRDRARLEAALKDLGASDGEVDELDVTADPARHREVIARAFERAGGFDVVVLAVGVLGAQAGLDADPDDALEVMEVD